MPIAPCFRLSHRHPSLQAQVFALVCSALGFACSPPKDTGGAATDTAAPDDGSAADGAVPEAPPTWSVSLTAEGVEIDISGGPGGYWFGIVDAADRSWTAEDCLGGQDFGDGVLVSYCHDAGNAGRRVFDHVDRAQDMTPATTRFNASQEGLLTYILYSDPAFGGSGACWVVGANPGYYSEAGCL